MAIASTTATPISAIVPDLLLGKRLFKQPCDENSQGVGTGNRFWSLLYQRAYAESLGQTSCNSQIQSGDQKPRLDFLAAYLDVGLALTLLG
jgi:hypothetical protein